MGPFSEAGSWGFWELCREGALAGAMPYFHLFKPNRFFPWWRKELRFTDCWSICHGTSTGISRLGQSIVCFTKENVIVNKAICVHWNVVRSFFYATCTDVQQHCVCRTELTAHMCTSFMWPLPCPKSGSPFIPHKISACLSEEAPNHLSELNSSVISLRIPL